MGKKVMLYIDATLLDMFDQARGTMPRGKAIRKIVEYLSKTDPYWIRGVLGTDEIQTTQK